jgi:hypothetical protein
VRVRSEMRVDTSIESAAELRNRGAEVVGLIL